MARRLTDRFRVLGIDLRGHGGSDPPRRPAELAYEALARDVLAVLDALGVGEHCMVGESLGGGVGIVVDRLRPGATRRLMLCEAIAFDPGALRSPDDSATGAVGPVRPHASAARAGDRLGGNPMADMARRRRRVWPDRAAVRASYATRAPFDVVAPEALDAYLRWGFVDRADGQVELACDPETEATIFELSSGPAGSGLAFAHLPRMRGRVEVLHGASSYLPAAWFRAQADAAGCELRTIAGGHFFLQEDTGRAAALVREVLAW